MVTIRKKTTRGRTYYYLEHSVKVDGKVENKSRYLGATVPKNVEEMKSRFLWEIYSEKWFGKLDKIRENYLKESRKMPKEVQDKFLQDFMVKFTYNSNRIEGSSLSLRDNVNLLIEGISPKKPINDIKEAETHKKVFYMMLNHKRDLNQQTVLLWHKELFRETKPNLAGKIRDYQVVVTGSKSEFPFPAELNVLLKEFFAWYDKNKSKLHPVVLTALTHFKFVSIHPFGDGNGRVSRLMMNFVLHKHGYPMLNIDYKNRDSYYNALERSQLRKLDHTFVSYLIKRYLKEYRKYLKN